MKNIFFKKIFLKKIYFLFPIIILSGCSLKYGMTVYDESSIPEFSFDNAKFTRYENNKISMQLDAERLEQYNSGRSMYAKNVSFKTINNEGNAETEGTCGLISVDNNKEQYIMYDQIQINNIKEELQISADSLKWNGKSEQLTSGKNEMVTIKQKNTTMYGSGFSASGVSKKYAFTGVVSGTIKNSQGENIENQ